jgi:putative CocE/NonD family hydrolase
MKPPRRLLALLPIALLFAGPASAQERVSRPGEYRGYSEPVYDGWRRSSFYLAMRDGVRLAVDLIRPTRQGTPHPDPLPVVWTHHRYNRAFFRNDSLIEYPRGFGRGVDRLLHHGYVVAVVDTRGGGASFGNQHGFFQREEARDAYEITEWLAAQPWSTGSVGMMGRSYLGITQLFAAAERPPHLRAIFPEMAVFEWYPMIYPGGVFRDDFFTSWQRLTQQLDASVPFVWNQLRFQGVAPVDGPNGMLVRDSAIAGHRANRDMYEMWSGVRYRNSRDSRTGQPIHLERGPATYLADINRSGVAVYGLAGWLDAFPRDALLWFANLTVPQKLIVGPWFHGESQGFDLGAERLRWFDYWLKGIDNGVMREPPIRYFVLDAPAGGEWRTARSWPLPEAVATPFYFAGGPAGSSASRNDGRLAAAPPHSRFAADSQVVDTTATLGEGTRWANTYGGPIGYPDLAPNDAKGWVYTSEPLPRPVEVIGHPIVHLWVRSSAGDVDAFVYLEDVDPSGRSTYVTEGVLRASHRRLAAPPFENFGLPWPRSHAEDVAPLPAEAAELVFDLLPTAKRFRAGHRIRVAVQGADRHTHRQVYPSPPPLVAIHRDAARPSRIVLPLVPIE